MEPEEIAVVLTRASELHSKLSDAIAFVVQDCPSARVQDLQNGDGSSEFHSLAAIREALEILEEQLESLQALQQQQRAERDAGLAEIEESRRVFLKRLKDHRGRELEIVQEALAFAGGSVADKDEFPPPGYPTVTDDESSHAILVSIPSGRSSIGPRQATMEEEGRSGMFGFEVEEAQEEGSEGDSTYLDEDDKVPDSLIGAAVKAANAVRNSVTRLGAFSSAWKAVRSSVALLGHLVGKITGNVTGPSSKVMLIVVTTVAVLSLTDLGERRTKSVARVSRMPAHRSHQHHMIGQGDKANSSSPKAETVEKPSVLGETAKRVEDDFPKCVVRERLELPFYQELQTPDVLHGRG